MWCPLCRRVPARFGFSVGAEGPSKLPRACWNLIDSDAPFGGDHSGVFRCWLCHTHYYRQHEYEFDPGGSWDDYAYVRLDLEAILTRIGEGVSEETHLRARARAYLRLFVFTVLTLGLEQ